MKVGPFFSSVANMAQRLVEAGADGLVLFNRFIQPDIDLETLAVDPALHLSHLARSCGCRCGGSRSCAGGWTPRSPDHRRAHRPQDAVKVILAGADVAMMACALFREGPEHLRTVLDGMTAWMDERDYVSVEQLRGAMSMANVPDPVAYARANYARLVTNYVSPYDWRMTDEGPLA